MTNLSAYKAEAVDRLTTHRHGENKEACTYCAAYYGGLWDALAPLIAVIKAEAWEDGYGRNVEGAL